MKHARTHGNFNVGPQCGILAAGVNSDLDMKRAPESTREAEGFGRYFAIGEAIAKLLHPYAEVVLHNVESGRIVKVWNPFSDRGPGTPSHLEGAPDLFTEGLVLGPYEKALPGQGRTKSITAALCDDAGKTVGYFCINLDVSALDMVSAVVQAFSSPGSVRPEPLYRSDIQEHVNYVVRDFLLETNKTLNNLTRSDRVALVACVEEAGLFQARNSVLMLAKCLKMSRASVYKLLAEAKLLAQAKRQRGQRDRKSPRIAAAEALPAIPQVPKSSKTKQSNGVRRSDRSGA
jgi:predicted transcriptional regulator YheO